MHLFVFGISIQKTNMLKFSIPRPCQQDWNNMSSNDQGRFCGSCMKTVIDFSNMHEEDVKNYLLQNIHNKTCGRFSSHQLKTIRIELPSTVLQYPMPGWKKFLLACLVVFSFNLFSCEVVQQKDNAYSTIGEIMMNSNNTDSSINELLPDTIPMQEKNMDTFFHPPLLVGDIHIEESTIDSGPIEEKEILMGLPVFIEDSTLIKNPPMADSIVCEKFI